MTASATPESTPAPARRRFRLSLRGLMILVLVVGGGIGWKILRVRSERSAVEAIRAAGGTVLYDYQFALDEDRMEQIRRSVPEPSGPAWLRRWLGDDFFRSAVSVRLPQPTRADQLALAVGLRGLIHLEVADTTGLGDAWTTLGGASRLQSIQLVGPGVTDATVETLKRMTALRSITFLNCPITSDGIQGLIRLRWLRSLEFGVCPDLTDAGVARLLQVALPNLESFRWSKAPGPVFETLYSLGQHHPNLRQLSLLGSPADDTDLGGVSSLRRLTSLNLTQTRVTDAGLEHLQDLDRLESLWIPLPGVTDLGLKSLGKLPALQTLVLSGSQVGDAGLTELAGLIRLTRLDLNQTRVTDAGMPQLAALTALETLNLNQTAITDTGLAPLRVLKALKFLRLGATQVTPGGITFLQTALPACAINTAIFRSGGVASAPKPVTPTQP